jgi:hypothetical protein
MSFYDEISDDEFVEAIFSFDLTQQEVGLIEKEYTFKNKSVMKNLEESVLRAYNKKLSQPRVIYEWTIEDYKKEEADLVEF